HLRSCVVLPRSFWRTSEASHITISNLAKSQGSRPDRYPKADVRSPDIHIPLGDRSYRADPADDRIPHVAATCLPCRPRGSLDEEGPLRRAIPCRGSSGCSPPRHWVPPSSSPSRWSSVCWPAPRWWPPWSPG